MRQQMGMAGVRDFSRLICWQLADALRIETLKLTAGERFSRDFKHRAQTEDAIDSVCRNIAEGFGCESHAEFARYLEISRRSVNELRDTLRSAHLKGYASPSDLSAAYALIHRLYPALNNFIAYLRRTPTPKRRGTDDDRARPDKNRVRTDKNRVRTDKNRVRTDDDR